MRKLLRWLANHLPYVKGHMASYRALANRVAELESDVEERDVRTSELLEMVSNYKAQIEDLNNKNNHQYREITRRDELIERQRRDLDERDGWVSDLEEKIAQCNSWFEELSQKVIERDRIIEELRLKTINIGEFASGEFWENIYASGGNSGTGSRGKLEKFKTETVNSLISEFEVKSLIDIGCGDGEQLATLKIDNYVGVDVSETVIKLLRKKFEKDECKRFYHLSDREQYINEKYDAALSQDVIFHLLEQDVFESYIDDLFNVSGNIVIIYSSNHESYTPWPEYRHRNFTCYVAQAHPEFELIRYIPNKYPYIIGNENVSSASDYYIFRRIA